MVQVSINEFTNKESGAKFYYFKPQSNRTVSTKEIAKRISKECTVSFADVLAVLQALGEDIPEYLRDGAQVKLDGLGKMRLRLKQVSTNDVKELTANNITNAVVTFRAEDELRNVFDGMEFETVSSRREQALAKSAIREGKTISVVSK